MRRESNRPPLTYYSAPLPGIQCSELPGKLIVIEGPDGVGVRSQVSRLKLWLENRGHAVLDPCDARSALAGKGLSEAKAGHTLGPKTMTLFYAADFADCLENEIIPALRAGFVVITTRYVFSIMARAVVRGQNDAWLRRTFGFALVPHLVLYLRSEVRDLVSRVVMGRGAFDYWDSGMDLRLGGDMHDSFVRYQSRLIKVFDRLAKTYDFYIVDARRPLVEVSEALKDPILRLLQGERVAAIATPCRRKSVGLRMGTAKPKRAA